MRQIYGAVFACLAIVSVSACGEASPPPAEGSALVQNITNGITRSIGGSSGPADIGTTVLDGTDGVRVSCTVKRNGGSISVNGHIQSADMALDISTSDIAANAVMTFFIQGSTLEAENSVDSNNNPAATCKITTSEAGSAYVAKAGSIYAGFDCPTVRPPSNPNMHHMLGRFLFTGCNK